MKSVGTVLPRVKAIWNGTVWKQNTLSGFGTTPYKTPSGLFLYYRDTIDMSSFVVQNKTFFPANLEVAEPGVVQCGPLPVDWLDSAGLIVMDVVTSAPLAVDDTLDDMVNNIFPGFPDSEIDMQFITYGRVNVYSANTTNSFPSLMSIISSQKFGSGLPTAADKLFVYRFVVPSASAPFAFGTTPTLDIPATQLTFVGDAREESELARVYRIRQSYEQKQG